MSEYDYEAAVVSMLTLRLNTPAGKWLRDDDSEVFAALQREAIDAGGEEWGTEYLLLSMMNAAWLAIAHLAEATGEDQDAWLQRIARELRGLV